MIVKENVRVALEKAIRLEILLDHEKEAIEQVKDFIFTGKAMDTDAVSLVFSLANMYDKVACMEMGNYEKAGHRQAA